MRSGLPRRFIPLVLILTLTLIAAAFAGCSTQGKKETSDGIVISPSVKLYIGAVIENETELTAKLGEPVKRQESQSCIAVGTDVNLSYDGFSIVLYPHEETAHVIGSIKISSDKYSTVSGMRPGDNIASVDPSGYTLSYSATNTYTYTMGSSENYLIVSTDGEGNIASIILGSSAFDTAN